MSLDTGIKGGGAQFLEQTQYQLGSTNIHQ